VKALQKLGFCPLQRIYISLELTFLDEKSKKYLNGEI
jgi:hypothetical protein